VDNVYNRYCYITTPEKETEGPILTVDVNNVQKKIINVANF